MTGPSIDHVLFDFGDTLVRQPFFVNGPPQAPNWAESVLEAYESNGLIDRWCVGELAFDAVVAAIARQTGTEAAAARAAMEADCRRLRENHTALDFARERGRRGRAAIVTVNPDLFSSTIVPAMGLDRDFPVIVTSWQERTLDKVELCRIALERLSDRPSIGTALLVDNDATNVSAFVEQGGQGYRFTTDRALARDLDHLRDRLKD